MIIGVFWVQAVYGDKALVGYLLSNEVLQRVRGFAYSTVGFGGSTMTLRKFCEVWVVAFDVGDIALARHGLGRLCPGFDPPLIPEMLSL